MKLSGTRCDAIPSVRPSRFAQVAAQAGLSEPRAKAALASMVWDVDADYASCGCLVWCWTAITSYGDSSAAPTVDGKPVTGGRGSRP